MSRRLILSALALSAAAAWGQYDLVDGLTVLYVLSEDVAFGEHNGRGDARMPAGPWAVPSGPIMRGQELPADVAQWLATLRPEDTAILYVLHGPRGLSWARFPAEELAALTNACACGSLMVVLDLPVGPGVWTIEELASERRRAELFERHTIIMTAKPWGARYWTTFPTGAGLVARLGVHWNAGWIEEDEVGTSLFGAYLFAALRGYGDTNFDRQVTAREAFEYAFWCTWVDCSPPGSGSHGDYRQAASARPGSGWDERPLATGIFFGWPDPLRIAAAQYTTLHFVSPFALGDAPGPAGPPGPDMLPASPWPDGAEGIAKWTWGNIAATEERVARLEDRLRALAILAPDPPARFVPPRWQEGEPLLVGPRLVGSGSPGWPGPADAGEVAQSVIRFLEGRIAHEQLVTAQANEQTLLALGQAVREAEFEVARLAVVCADYYAVEALSISPQFIAPTQWPDGLPAPYAVRGPAGPPGPVDGAGTLGEPERVEALWAEATTQRLRELADRVRAVSEQAQAATRAFSEATGGWGGLER